VKNTLCLDGKFCGYMKTTVLKMSYSQSKNYSPQVQVKTTVLTMNTSPPSQDQLNFVRTSNFFSFYLEIQSNLY